MRIGLESLITIKIGDKIKQHIRLKSQTDNVNIRSTSKFKAEDVSCIIQKLFLDKKEYEAFDKMYRISSNVVHHAISSPNYISWGCFSFVRQELEKMIGKLNPDDVKLEDIIGQLQEEEKLCFI